MANDLPVAGRPARGYPRHANGADDRHPAFIANERQRGSIIIDDVAA